MRTGIDARLLHYQAGGISQYTRQLVEALVALDHDTDYRVLRMHQDARPVAHAPNLTHVGCWTPCHHRFERWTLSAEIARLRLDVLHATDFIPPAFGYRHAVITVHDLNFLHFPELLTPDSRSYYVRQIGWAVRRARRIIAVSQATRHDLLERLGVDADKIDVVYEAAENLFRPRSAEDHAPVLARYRLTPGYLLFVGTLEPRKNLPMLLQAYARLRARRPDTPPLVLAGRKGWLFQEIFSTAVRLDLVRHVRFVDSPRREDLPALYSGAGALALISLYEGFGLPVLEAMQCGTPVVISTRPALPEIAGDAALQADPRNPDEISAALERALGDEALRADLRARGLARAAQFSWAQAARETLDVYRAAAGA
jgi:glycosyltransferase involved in cell wall biosynthesis